MTIEELINELKVRHQKFVLYIQSMPSEKVIASRNRKWSAAQQVDHLIKSVSPVRLAFSLPTFLLRIRFGVANRPSRSYDELVSKYKAKLAAGGKASSRFIPKKEISISHSTQKLTRLIDSLCHHLNSYSETQLDQFILPHPLLGKLTLREMLYFTIYHVQHHLDQVKSNTHS